MKKLILLLTIVLNAFSLLAQAPQAVCYQAVATDQAGREIINQNVRLKLSILKGSASGTEEWVETHAVSTDGFGLFDLNIGQGTRTGGVRTNFADINWGNDRYFLRVEMDINGGTNYVLMGTNQMVSVPYALYTERAKNASFADSAAVSSRALTANTAITAQTATRANFADSAAVSNRAVTATTAITAQTANRAAFADSSAAAARALTANSARRADTANFAWYADSSRRADVARRASVADSANRAQIAWNAVSANRAIVADSSAKASFASTAATAQDDRDRDPTNEIQTLLFDNNILTLRAPNGTTSQVNFSFYPFSLPGASLDFPLGVSGEAVLVTTNYTVPTGKTLFITSLDNALELLDGRILFSRPSMPIIPSNTTISSCYCSGLLIGNQASAVAQIWDFTNPSTEYTVPAGRTMVIKSGSTSAGRMDFWIEGDNYSFYTGGNQAPRSIVVPAGKRIRKAATLLPSDRLVVTGYLLTN